MSRTQKQIVLDLLAERGERGVSAREAIYDLHITRLAAIIFDLKQDGMLIRTEQKKGETARYFLEGNRKVRDVKRCQCGHLYRAHIAGMKCLAQIPTGTLLDEDCPCEKFTEAMVEA